MKRFLTVLFLILVLAMSFTALGEESKAKEVANWMLKIFPEAEVYPEWESYQGKRYAYSGMVTIDISMYIGSVYGWEDQLRIRVKDYTSSEKDSINNTYVSFVVSNDSWPFDTQTFLDDIAQVAAAYGLTDNQIKVSCALAGGYKIPSAWKNDVDCSALLAEMEGEPISSVLFELIQKLTDGEFWDVQYQIYPPYFNEATWNEVNRAENGTKLIEFHGTNFTVIDYNADALMHDSTGYYMPAYGVDFYRYSDATQESVSKTICAYYSQICNDFDLRDGELEITFTFNERDEYGYPVNYTVKSLEEAEQFAEQKTIEEAVSSEDNKSAEQTAPAAQATETPVNTDDSALGTVKVLGGTNVRAAANSSSAVAGFIAKDGSYQYYEIVSGWYKIKLEDGSFGYVYQSRIG